LFLGSVAEQVPRSVNLPVITVGPEAHLAVGNSDVRVVLHATTLRETSRPSAALACQMAASQHARFVLMHETPAGVDSFRGTEPTDPSSTAIRQLQQLAAVTRSGSLYADVLVEIRDVHGHPAIAQLTGARRVVLF
jgi:hypothetical protein